MRLREGRFQISLAALLAFWLALFPVLQSLHLAFADHDHCLNPEQRLIEDVPRLGCTVERQPTGTAQLATTHGQRLAGQVDELMSFSLQDSLSRRVLPVTTALDRPSVPLRPVPAEPVVGLSHLRIAPKTSPPAAALA